MIVGIFQIEIRLPESSSLKDKRNVLGRLVNQLRKEQNICITQTNHRNLRQRATLGMACISRSEYQARNLLDSISNLIESRYPVEIIETKMSTSDLSDVE